MSAEADAVGGAPYGMPGPGRVNVRNGYRHRDFDTRAGTLDVAIPKLRSGSYFPGWLLERRRRAEAALTSACSFVPAACRSASYPRYPTVTNGSPPPSGLWQLSGEGTHPLLDLLVQEECTTAQLN
jgi:hypothetical protein